MSDREPLNRSRAATTTGWLAVAVVTIAVLVGACTSSATSPAASAGNSTDGPSTSPDPLGSWPPYQGLGSPYPTTVPGVDVGVEAHGAMSTVTFGRLRFDVPAAWTYRPMNAYVKTITDVGFVGTADSRAGCFTNTVSTMTTMRCVVDYRLREGDVSLLLELQDGPGVVKAGDPQIEPSVPTQGLPGVIDRLVRLTVPEPDFRQFRVLAAIRGDADGSRLAAVMAAFQSLRLDPPLVPPSASVADQLALVRGTLAQLRAADGSAYRCFPETPGTEQAARVRRFLGNGFDTRERDVVCRTDLSADRSGDWLLTLTMLWNARADHVAATVRVHPDGAIGQTTFDGAPPTQ
jgi:hypothetical protein